ncbi:chaplin family protein [Streptomyces sp. H62]
MGKVVRARSVRRQVVLVTAALGAAVLAPAASAHANIIGVGNPAFGNSCANTGGGAQASGAAVASPGVLAANTAQLPLHLSRNECGNSGITCLVQVF